MTDNKTTNNSIILNDLSDEIVRKVATTICVFNASFTVDALKAVSGCTDNDLNRALDQLLYRGLISFDIATQRYTFHADVCKSVTPHYEQHLTHYDFFLKYVQSITDERELENFSHEIYNIDKAFQWTFIFLTPLHSLMIALPSIDLLTESNWDSGRAWLEKLEDVGFIEGSDPWVELKIYIAKHYLNSVLVDNHDYTYIAYNHLLQVNPYLAPTQLRYEDVIIRLNWLLYLASERIYLLEHTDAILQESYSYLLEIADRLDFSTCTEETKFVSSALLSMYGLLHMHYGDRSYLQMAIRLSEQITEVCQKKGTLSVSLLLDIADVYNQLSEHKKSAWAVYRLQKTVKKLSEQAIDIATSPPERFEAYMSYARANYRIATVPFTKVKSNIDESNRIIWKAFDLVQKDNAHDANARANAYLQLALNLQLTLPDLKTSKAQNQHKQIIEYYNRAHSETVGLIDVDLSRTISYANALSKYSHCNTEYHEKAIKLYFDALRVFQKRSNVPMQLALFTAISEEYAKQRNYRLAIEYSDYALDIAIILENQNEIDMIKGQRFWYRLLQYVPSYLHHRILLVPLILIIILVNIIVQVLLYYLLVG